MKNLLSAFIFLCIVSCELSPPPPACVLSASLIDLKPDSKSYQTAVMAKLESSTSQDFRYFFKTFIDKEDKTFMQLNFRNEKDCFDVDVLVEKWEKLAGMKKVNGQSYPKELINLKWKIEELNGVKSVVYEDMDWIID